jgi:hypothetical protein
MPSTTWSRSHRKADTMAASWCATADAPDTTGPNSCTSSSAS